jgi:hypothetical protein
MCVYVYVHVRMCVCMYVVSCLVKIEGFLPDHIYIQCVCAHTRACVCCVRYTVFVFVPIQARVHLCMNVCMYVCIYIYIYTCVHQASCVPGVKAYFLNKTSPTRMHVCVYTHTCMHVQTKYTEAPTTSSSVTWGVSIWKACGYGDMCIYKWRVFYAFYALVVYFPIIRGPSKGMLWSMFKGMYTHTTKFAHVITWVPPMMAFTNRYTHGKTYMHNTHLCMHHIHVYTSIHAAHTRNSPHHRQTSWSDSQAL